MLTKDQLCADQDTLGATAPYPAFALNSAIELAKTQLLGLQNRQGYWMFELEADCTIPAEYILMMHYLNEIDSLLQTKIAHFLRSRQNPDGSYPLYKGGAGDISCTIKVYYALKLAGDAIESPILHLAGEWIRTQGGAAKANVFTRIMLAMFEQVPWRATPFIPVEIMLLPKWFPFHLDKISYWSRTVMVPLSILCSYKVKAKNPGKIGVSELFLIPPDQEKQYFSQVKTPLGKAILLLDRLGQRLESFIPGGIRRKATAKACDWFMARLNGIDGLGAIFTAMVNAYEVMDYLGVPIDDPQRRIARASIDKLLVVKDESAYCQPCVSPIWDTGLAALTLQEVDRQTSNPEIKKALDAALHWLAGKQLRDEPGDWQIQRPGLRGGGWAFQFSNSFYPDVDDTAVVAYAMLQADRAEYAENIQRASGWIAGMQSHNGGYGAFDADNTYFYLNQIPFADHGALLDPPTADVSGRCMMLLGKLAVKQLEYADVVDNGIAYLRAQQEEDGSWFGRWGTNYIYGTWSVLYGYEAAGIPRNDPSIQKAVLWLKAKQRADGGWGEDNASYHDETVHGEAATSTAFHSALAILALLSAGERESPAVEAGVHHLLKTQLADGFWHDDGFNAPGFPRFFYLKYHGYDKFFPLWALARYRNESIVKVGTETLHGESY